MSWYASSELILNPDGTIFHLKLLPGQVPDTVILVGDPGRVAMVSEFLDKPEHLSANREFTSTLGSYNNRPVLVLSTGIGTDNMDIVVNELDALVNIDLAARTTKKIQRSLRLIRIGTSGALQPDMPVGSGIATLWSVGLDGLLHYYRRPETPERIAFETDLRKHLDWPASLAPLYGAQCGQEYPALFPGDFRWGITVAAHGFYGPQGRYLRAGLAYPDLNKRLSQYRYRGIPISNFEMESSALYGLSEILGHSALTVCLIVANRARKEFLTGYQESMKKLIGMILMHVT